MFACARFARRVFLDYHLLHLKDRSPPVWRDIPVDLVSTVQLCTRVGVQNLCQREGKCLYRIAGTCGPAMAASARAAGGAGDTPWQPQDLGMVSP